MSDAHSSSDNDDDHPVPRLRLLLIAWFMSCCSHRTLKLVTPFFLAWLCPSVQPKSAIAFHGTTQAALMIVIMPIVTPKLSRLPRKIFVVKSLVLSSSALVALCCGTYLLQWLDGQSIVISNPGTRTLLVSLITVASIMSYVGYMCHWMAIRRDWPVQLCSGNVASLAAINAELEALEVGSDVCIALVTSFIGFSIAKGWIVLTGRKAMYSAMVLIGSQLLAATMYAMVANANVDNLSRSGTEMVETQKRLVGTNENVRNARERWRRWTPGICHGLIDSRWMAPILNIESEMFAVTGLLMIAGGLVHFNALAPGNGLMVSWLSTKNVQFDFTAYVKLLASVVAILSLMSYAAMKRSNPLLSSPKMQRSATCYLAGIQLVVSFLATNMSRTIDERGPETALLWSFGVDIALCRLCSVFITVSLSNWLQLHVAAENRGTLNGAMFAVENAARLTYLIIGVGLKFPDMVSLTSAVFGAQWILLVLFSYFAPNISTTANITQRLIQESKNLKASSKLGHHLLHERDMDKLLMESAGK